MINLTLQCGCASTVPRRDWWRHKLPSLRSSWTRTSRSALYIYQPFTPRSCWEVETRLQGYTPAANRTETTELRFASDMPANLSALVFVFFLLLACQQVLTVDPHDVQEKPASPAKRRLSLQSTGQVICEGCIAVHGAGTSTALQLCEPPVLSGQRDGVLAPERVLLQTPTVPGSTGPHGHHGQPGPVPLDVSSGTVRGAGELPVEVWRGGQVVGQPAVAWAVRATLGGAVQKLQRHLFPRPIGRSAAHHHSTTYRALAYHCSGTRAAANQSSRIRRQQRAQSD